MTPDLAQYIGEISRRILGSPNTDLSNSTQLRFGHNGSVAVEIAGPKAGTWYDHEAEIGGNTWNLLTLKGGVLPAAAHEWLKRELGIETEKLAPKPKNQIIATYDYVDENGVLLFQALRYGPKKTFVQRAPDGNGGWKVGPKGTWTIEGVRIVPYHLPEIISAPSEVTIFVPEGEKDANNLRKIGCFATCNPMGAGKWRNEFAKHFKDKNVVVLPDNDETGRAHALDVAANLAPVSASIRILELPGLPEKGDVSDWLDAGGTREELEQLAAAAPVFDPNVARPQTPTQNSDRGSRDIRVFLGAPYEIADIFLRERFTNEGHRTLHHYRGSFYEWTGCAYPGAETENLRSRLYDFLATRCYYNNSDGKRCPVNPDIKLVNKVLDGLRAKAHLPTSVSAPGWLDGANEDQRKLEPKDIVACSNGLLHLPTLALLPHTPEFFCHNALEFPYNPDAPVPLEWHKFLGQLWPGDFELIDTLHEIFGYLLTGDTSLQKIFFLIGPRRSGKGTIAKVLRRLLGQYNCCAPTLAGLGTEFGLQPLIGKLVAIIGDARLGGRVDQTAIVERLLSISGEDELNINRKNLTHWIGQLISRIIILSNEIPKLTDASSALVGRFIILRLTKSFFGNEDPELFDRLLPEMPGILNLAIAGWRRLKQRGYFQQPASSDDVAEQFEDISSPIKQFVRERCILDPDNTVTRDALFAAWCNWCAAEGRDHPGTKVTFGKDLSAAFPEIGEKRFGKGPRDAQERTRVYAGIKLRSQESWGYDERGFWHCINGIKRRSLTWGIDLNNAPQQSYAEGDE